MDLLESLILSDVMLHLRPPDSTNKIDRVLEYMRTSFAK